MDIAASSRVKRAPAWRPRPWRGGETGECEAAGRESRAAASAGRLGRGGLRNARMWEGAWRVRGGVWRGRHQGEKRG